MQNPYAKNKYSLKVVNNKDNNKTNSIDIENITCILLSRKE